MLEINCSNINAYGEGLEDYSMFCQGIGVLVLYTNSC
jgi:outer membrane phospholipase A